MLFSKKKKRIGLTRHRARLGYAFISPFIIGFIFFMIKPLYQSLTMSLSAVDVSVNGFIMEWNNYGNYVRAFTVDPEFNRMLVTSIATMFYRSLATIVFSFFVALLLNQKFKGRALVRSIFFLCVILSSGVLVGLEYNNALLSQLKATIEEQGSSNTITAVLEEILVSNTGGVNGISGKVFKTLFEIIDSIYDVAMASGIQIIIFLSGLQNISPSMYEAADMEGCTSWERLWKITVPMVSPLLLVCWVYTIIDFFTKSDNVIMKKINDVMIGQLNYGFSSALAWIYFIVVMAMIGLTSLIISKVVYNYD
ncbi:MAG: sugar ABC transporter permease [Spirochaetaceae bacterium]|nr:sugar ABC transporter permease [Spirochaetaceae bacterium]MBO4727352.1 sugar ABC transporter permease [Spirochaetaceae bacterium]MBR4824086.1 sugar ABC transporter permease [Spirochaetaceae bacterium]